MKDGSSEFCLHEVSSKHKTSRVLNDSDSPYKIQMNWGADSQFYSFRLRRRASTESSRLYKGCKMISPGVNDGLIERKEVEKDEDTNYAPGKTDCNSASHDSRREARAAESAQPSPNTTGRRNPFNNPPVCESLDKSSKLNVNSLDEQGLSDKQLEGACGVDCTDAKFGVVADDLSCKKKSYHRLSDPVVSFSSQITVDNRGLEPLFGQLGHEQSVKECIEAGSLTGVNESFAGEELDKSLSDNTIVRSKPQDMYLTKAGQMDDVRDERMPANHQGPRRSLTSGKQSAVNKGEYGVRSRTGVAEKIEPRLSPQDGGYYSDVGRSLCISRRDLSVPKTRLSTYKLVQEKSKSTNRDSLAPCSLSENTLMNRTKTSYLRRADAQKHAAKQHENGASEQKQSEKSRRYSTPVAPNPAEIELPRKPAVLRRRMSLPDKIPKLNKEQAFKFAKPNVPLLESAIPSESEDELGEGQQTSDGGGRETRGILRPLFDDVKRSIADILFARIRRSSDTYTTGVDRKSKFGDKRTSEGTHEDRHATFQSCRSVKQPGVGVTVDTREPWVAFRDSSRRRSSHHNRRTSLWACSEGSLMRMYGLFDLLDGCTIIHVHVIRMLGPKNNRWGITLRQSVPVTTGDDVLFETPLVNLMAAPSLVRVKHIAPRSPSSDSKLRKGDAIMEVNHQIVLGATLNAVRTLIDSASEHLFLIVARKPQMYSYSSSSDSKEDTMEYEESEQTYTCD
ncbi:uncharacterized protein [Ptychodera flava]|uniref:uncharacterized protein n=1 Tax=Ptychodera flava TaxID=63121 RepID=UPI00396A9DED